MVDFYTASAGCLFAALGLGVLYIIHNCRSRSRRPTPDNGPIPDIAPKPVIPIEPRPEASFDLTPIVRTVRASSTRKRNVGGRANISDIDLKRFESLSGDITYDWSSDIEVSGPGKVSVNGGGTPSSRFIDLKLSRTRSRVEAYAFGYVQCVVKKDGDAIAIGRSSVKLGITPLILN